MLDANEEVGAMWIPQRMLLDPTQHSFRRVPGMPAEGWFPAIALPGAPLWGFTSTVFWGRVGLVFHLRVVCGLVGDFFARMRRTGFRSGADDARFPAVPGPDCPESMALDSAEERRRTWAGTSGKSQWAYPGRRRNRIFLRPRCHRCQSKPHRGTAGVHSNPRAGFRGVPDRSRHGLNVGTQARTGFCHATGRGPRGVDSTNLGARVQNRSTLMTIALITGLPFGKDKRRGGS